MAWTRPETNPLTRKEINALKLNAVAQQFPPADTITFPHYLDLMQTVENAAKADTIADSRVKPTLDDVVNYARSQYLVMVIDGTLMLTDRLPQRNNPPPTP